MQVKNAYMCPSVRQWEQLYELRVSFAKLFFSDDPHKLSVSFFINMQNEFYEHIKSN